MGANDDVNVRNLFCQLLVSQVARVTDGHNDVYSLGFQLANLPGESFNLILKNKPSRHIGGPDGLRGEVTHKADLSSSSLDDDGLLRKTVKLRHISGEANLLAMKVGILRCVHIGDNHGYGAVPQEGLKTF